MTLRRTLYVGLGVVALAVVFVGFTAYVTHQQVQAALAADLNVETLFRRANVIIAVSAALGLGVVIGFGVYVQRAVLRPLDALIDGVETIDTAGLDQQIDLDRSDELGLLARAIDRMTTSISRRTVSRTYLNNILDSMAEMLFVVDENNRIDHVNLAAMERLGFSREEMKGRSLDDLLEGDAPLPSPDDTVFRRTGSVTEIERKLRTSDGSTLPVLVSRSLLRGSSADAPDIVCVAQDISARKEAEEQLRDSLQEKEVLLREIHHRVKNNLQVIASLLHVQSKKVEDEDARRLFAESQDRIRSMAFIHERLYQSDDLAQVDFGAYLDRLTEHLYRSHGVALRDVTCHLDTDSAVLGVDRAIPAGLIINELVSNALEHAFPEDSTGTINVSFTTEDEVGTIVVADDGVGVDDADDLESERTLGMRLVNGLVRQLRGEVDVNGTDGLQFTITFPLTDDS